MPEVILRDFDGTETVFPQDSPLPEVIHTGEAEEDELIVTRHYLKTSERDPEGRPVYVQSNL